VLAIAMIRSTFYSSVTIAVYNICIKG
jgi:hypothetical protein